MAGIWISYPSFLCSFISSVSLVCTKTTQLRKYLKCCLTRHRGPLQTRPPAFGPTTGCSGIQHEVPALCLLSCQAHPQEDGGGSSGMQRCPAQGQSSYTGLSEHVGNTFLPYRASEMPNSEGCFASYGCNVPKPHDWVLESPRLYPRSNRSAFCGPPINVAGGQTERGV